VSEAWTHALCDGCYDSLEPDRVPSRVKGSLAVCCKCAAVTASGIYYRADPDQFHECDHDDGFLRTLRASMELLSLHVENLIERVHELERWLGTPPEDEP
jgi:hypothetical protein